MCLDLEMQKESIMGWTRGRLAGVKLLDMAGFILIIAIVAAVALPRLARVRRAANEAQAVLLLRHLAASEGNFKRSGAVDQDADGMGEYGLLAELAGQVPLRAGQARLSTPLVPQQLLAAIRRSAGGGEEEGYVSPDGCFLVGGYVYRAYLAAAVDENQSVQVGDDRTLGGTRSHAGATLTDVDAIDLQEQHFAIYAWPLEAGATGERVFVITETGRLLATDMKARQYSGRGPLSASNVPAADSAFTGEVFVSPLAEGKRGRDGNVWYLLRE